MLTAKFLILSVCVCSVWSSSCNGLPHDFGSEALRHHRQWLANFQRDIHLINLKARQNHTDELIHSISNGFHSEDRYPLFHARQFTVLSGRLYNLESTCNIGGN